jgi:hypothetical protein
VIKIHVERKLTERKWLLSLSVSQYVAAIVNAIAQADIRRLPTAEAQVLSQVRGHVGFVNKVALEQVSLANYHSID